MTPDLKLVEHISQGHVGLLRDIRRGLEKESLRVGSDGLISQTQHPVALGSALTHDFITTDYSEALMELITPASSDPEQPFNMMRDIHAFVYQHLGDEVLWPASMPCGMRDESYIPIARYGSSHNGRMKEIYRLGLGYRYGRFMQTIAGVHYNFSLPDSFWEMFYDYTQSQNASQPIELQDFISQQYMGLIRNYLRTSWIIPYLFGASPALCESYLQGKKTHLDQLTPGTVYGRYATSLRMGDLGYSNKAQARLNITYNNVTDYINGLEHAISTPEPLYEKIGVIVDDEYRQLNANLLQIENEYYSTIRPKRVAHPGERPSMALRRGGIEYIEVRALDLNLFAAEGITREQSAFIDCLLLHNLLSSSEYISAREDSEIAENRRRVVEFGRHPDLRLIQDNREVSLRRLAFKLFDDLMPMAKLLDAAQDTNLHETVLNRYCCLIESPDDTLSGQIVSLIKQRGDGFFQFARFMAEEHATSLRNHDLSTAQEKTFTEEVSRSFEKQQQLEDNSVGSFADFLAAYYR